MLSNTQITERNMETFTSAEKLCLSDRKKIALELLYKPPKRFLNYLRAIWTDENAKSIALS